MQENEIEEFCETSSWETSSDQEEFYDLSAEKAIKPQQRSPTMNNSNPPEDSGGSEEGSDAESEKISQNAWEIREENKYREEKRSWREYLLKSQESPRSDIPMDQIAFSREILEKNR